VREDGGEKREKGRVRGAERREKDGEGGLRRRGVGGGGGKGERGGERIARGGFSRRDGRDAPT